MVCVTVEAREGTLTQQAQITAPSIERALRIAGNRRPGCNVRLLFPIDPEVFFAAENLKRREAA